MNAQLLPGSCQKVARMLPESCPKVVSELLQTGFKVAGMHQTTKKGGGRKAPAPLFCCLMHSEAILKPLWDAGQFEASLKKF